MGCIVVFAKPPVAGRCKTRLGRRIGMEAAASVARALLVDSVERWRTMGHAVVLATPEPLADHGLDASVPTVDQGAGGLGTRLERVIRMTLDSEPWVLAVGADAPAVAPEAMAAAVAGLEAGRSVLGPTEDGGFWALGLHRCDPGLLHDLPWSHPETWERTRERLVARGHDPVDLPRSWDVDEVEDLVRLVAYRHLAPRSAALAAAWTTA